MKNAKITKIEPNNLGRAKITVEIDVTWNEVATILQQNGDGYITVRGKQ